jgi:two-component system, OmpR family, KDP operon response regulator KdpE
LVLEILAQHAGKVVTRQQIMKQVWGGPHLDDTHYLRIVVRKLRKKIEVDLTRPRILLTELGMVIAWCNSGGGQRSPAGSPSRNSGFIHS